MVDLTLYLAISNDAFAPYVHPYLALIIFRMDSELEVTLFVCLFLNSYAACLLSLLALFAVFRS